MESEQMVKGETKTCQDLAFKILVHIVEDLKDWELEML